MQPSQPIGRALRIVLGLALVIYIASVYFRVPGHVAIGSLLLTLGLIGVYCLIHIVIVRQIVAFGPGLATVVASALLVALYVVGASGLPIVGHGKGQLAAITFLAVSLVIAGARATPGCEVMAVPNLLFGRNADLICLIFSPIDRLESKLKRKHDV